MDKIAAEVGFFDDLFVPVVQTAVERAGGLSFDLVEQIRASDCPRASFHATLIAVAARAPMPAITIEAGLGLKKGERDLTNSPGLFPELKPQPVLRVLAAGGNELARSAGLRFHLNMRVPLTSVITRLNNLTVTDATALRSVESLSDWTTSRGGPIGEGDVAIEARRHGDKVIALITRA